MYLVRNKTILIQAINEVMHVYRLRLTLKKWKNVLKGLNHITRPKPSGLLGEKKIKKIKGLNHIHAEA